MPDKNLKFHSADGKRKILLIEDEPINREILSMMLADSYDVLCAENGARSLELLDAHCETLSLVLLVNTSRENCGVIQRRINDRFIIGRQRSSIEYHVNSVFWESPQQPGGKIRP